MAKFIIQPHGRLNDWVAHEKGYFTWMHARKLFDVLPDARVSYERAVDL